MLRGFAATPFFWLGPGELVISGVMRTGGVGIEVLLLWLAVALAALTSVTSVRLGVRAAVDLVARLLFVPTHAWSAAVVLLDAVLVAVAWYSAARGGEDR